MTQLTAVELDAKILATILEIVDGVEDYDRLSRYLDMFESRLVSTRRDRDFWKEQALTASDRNDQLRSALSRTLDRNERLLAELSALEDQDMSDDDGSCACGCDYC